jgi:hypothetical protein
MLEVGHIRKHYEKITKISGENFNVFQIIGLGSAEVRLHSAFLAELLNSQGSHGQGDTFLRLFIDQFGITDFETTNSITETEKYIGPINDDYSKGGKVDIVINDSKNRKNIIIENKIYATDGRNQLLRYHNYDKEAFLFYLTLEGAEPSAFSTGNKIDHYKTISYKLDIITWLEKCQKEAVSLPIIRESIFQYINLLKVLTHQTTAKTMFEEIKKAIILNPDYVYSIEESNKALMTIIMDTKKSFIENFNKHFSTQIIWQKEEYKIEVTWDEDSDGIFFGYHFLVNDKVDLNSEKAIKLGKKLRELDDSLHSSPWSFIWFNPEPIKRYVKFEHIDKKEILKMAQDTSTLEMFINKLILHESKIRSLLLEWVDKV